MSPASFVIFLQLSFHSFDKQTLISEGRMRGQITRSRTTSKDTWPEGRMSSSRFSQNVWKSLFALAYHIFLQHINRHVFKTINEMTQEMTKMLAFTDWFEDFAPLQIMSRRPSSHALAWFSDGPGRSRSRTLSLPRLMDFIQGHVRDVMTLFFFLPIRSNVTYSRKSGILGMYESMREIELRESRA